MRWAHCGVTVPNEVPCGCITVDIAAGVAAGLAARCCRGCCGGCRCGSCGGACRGFFRGACNGMPWKVPRQYPRAQLLHARLQTVIRWPCRDMPRYAAGTDMKKSNNVRPCWEGGGGTKAFTNAHYWNLQGEGATACFRARQTQSLRAVLAAYFVGTPEGASWRSRIT